mmetsp:Transcript_19462/g.39352  ORF Transcript_19462/g.39352 Transcript_19462/m.39352 type:complete len:205 (+) Transcript_19462:568-1182(+)
MIAGATNTHHVGGVTHTAASPSRPPGPPPSPMPSIWGRCRLATTHWMYSTQGSQKGLDTRRTGKLSVTTATRNTASQHSRPHTARKHRDRQNTSESEATSRKTKGTRRRTRSIGRSTQMCTSHSRRGSWGCSPFSNCLPAQGFEPFGLKCSGIVECPISSRQSQQNPVWHTVHVMWLHPLSFWMLVPQPGHFLEVRLIRASLFL